MRVPAAFLDLRRSAVATLSLLAVLGLLGWDWGVHQPLRGRVARLTSDAEQAGVSIRALLHPTLMPPAVKSLLEANALEPERLAELRRSGALAADLLTAVTELSIRSGIQVVATEPGVAVSSGNETLVRAHLRARGTYTEFVRFFDALVRGDRLIAVDQFTLTPIGGAELSIELRVSRLVVQRSQSAPSPEVAR